MIPKRLVVVGNAPIVNPYVQKIAQFLGLKLTNHDSFVDKSDVVIRMNETKYLGNGTGINTTILGLINVGKPSVKFSSTFLISKIVQEQLEEIWFSRPQNFQEPLLEHLPKAYFCDNSKEIISFQQFNPAKTSYISKEDFEHLTQIIAQKGYAAKPSTGLCMLYMAINEPAFKNFDKYIIGFNLNGWKGHNWKAEQEIIEDWLQKGEFLTLVTCLQGLTMSENTSQTMLTKIYET